jgi:hypothetical protein
MKCGALEENQRETRKKKRSRRSCRSESHGWRSLSPSRVRYIAARSIDALRQKRFLKMGLDLGRNYEDDNRRRYVEFFSILKNFSKQFSQRSLGNLT